MKANRISKAQIARIWMGAREIGLDRDMLYYLVPGGSISRLSRGQASHLIDALNNLARGPGVADNPAPLSDPCAQTCRYVSAASADPRMANVASHAQHEMINQLFARLGWRESPVRVAGFLRKFARVENIEEIADRKRASAVIEALKAILARQESLTN